MNHSNKQTQVSRRQFMQVMGVAGVGSMLGAGQGLAQTNSQAAGAETGTVPKRSFGKTGVKVSMLALGGIFDITMNQLVLQRALDLGVTYWDTANGYTNGRSETGIGMYLEKNPQVRKEIFLVTKAGTHSVDGLTRMLEESLRRMKTDYIDLYFIHGLDSPGGLTPEIKAWAEKAKASNKIRFFGFSAHGNMENNLLGASKLGWIDGIMLKYDYRLMHTDNMRAAVEACEKAGIGLTAMKTQGGGPIHAEDEAEQKLGGHFMKRGFTQQQAKVKAVWENPSIASICSQMGSVTVLTSNAAAAMDKTKLTQADHGALRRYAAETRSRYCAGCTQVCEGALGTKAPVGDIMRCLMYHHYYGDSRLALDVFQKLPESFRGRLATLDFTDAERVCPQRLPLGQLMRQAHQLLG